MLEDLGVENYLKNATLFLACIWEQNGPEKIEILVPNAECNPGNRF